MQITEQIRLTWGSAMTSVGRSSVRKTLFPLIASAYVLLTLT